jgi:dCMP deaminase
VNGNGRRLSRNELWLEIAKLYAARGTCDRAQVGCVIVKDNRVVSAGYNGAPPGLPHCIDMEDPHEVESLMGERGCRRAIHAEANAIAWAARQGTSVSGATLYTTHEPCLPCSQLIISAGVVAVYWVHDYKRNTGEGLLREAGVEIVGR